MSLTITGSGPPKSPLLISFDERVVGGGSTDQEGHFSVPLIVGNEAVGVHAIFVRVRGAPHILQQITCVVGNVASQSTPLPATATISTTPVQSDDTFQQKALDVILVIDQSGSMAGQKLDDVNSAAKILIDQLTDHDKVGVVTFSQSASLAQPLSYDRRTAETALDAIAVSGGSDLATGLAIADRELLSERHNVAATGVIIVLSDGRVKQNEQSLAMANALKTRGHRIITIAFGDNSNDDILRVIASSSDDFYALRPGSNLPDISQILTRPDVRQR